MGKSCYSTFISGQINFNKMTKQEDTVGETIAPNTTRGSDDVAYEKGNHAGSGDIAAQLVDTAIAADISPEEEKAVLRRVDMFLVSVMFLSFAFQYLDKACLTGAALFGILTDLDLLQIDFDGRIPVINTSRYSYASLIFYWGYLLGLLPGVYFSQRFPLGKYVSITMFIWGGVTVSTVAVNSYAGLHADSVRHRTDQWSYGCLALPVHDHREYHF